MMPELVLYHIPVQRVNPTKSIPDKYTVKLSAPPSVTKDYKGVRYGNILVDGDDIFYYGNAPELRNICLTKPMYSFRIKTNNEFINIRVSALDIFLSHQAYQLTEKEDRNNTVVLHDVPRTLLRDLYSMNGYQLKISFPARLRPYFQNTGHAPVAYAVVFNEDVKPTDNRLFDITLKYIYYVVLIIMDDSKNTYYITRSELIEAYNDLQQIKEETITERTEQVMAETDPAPDSLILRHLFRKNLKPFKNDTITIAVAVPASLKDKCTKWFCNLIVPASCVSDEQPVNNTQLISLELTQRTYEVHYPVSDTGEYHKFHQTHWEKAIISREEIYEAHRNMLNTYGFYKENNLT